MRTATDLCPSGHERTTQNTYIRKDKGTRVCKKCRLESQKRSKEVMRKRDLLIRARLAGVEAV